LLIPPQWAGHNNQNIGTTSQSCDHQPASPAALRTCRATVSRSLVGRVPSNFGDHGNRAYLVPSNFCDWLLFTLCAAGGLQCFPGPRSRISGKSGEEYSGGNGWNVNEAIMGHGEETVEEKEEGSASTHARFPPLPFQPWLHLYATHQSSASVPVSNDSLYEIRLYEAMSTKRCR